MMLLHLYPPSLYLILHHLCLKKLRPNVYYLISLISYSFLFSGGQRPAWAARSSVTARRSCYAVFESSFLLKSANTLLHSVKSQPGLGFVEYPSPSSKGSNENPDPYFYRNFSTALLYIRHSVWLADHVDSGFFSLYKSFSWHACRTANSEVAISSSSGLPRSDTQA